MLDRLSQVTTPQEHAQHGQVAGDTSTSTSLLDVRMHRCVAGLLVGRGSKTWQHLHASFPGEYLPFACLKLNALHGGIVEPLKLLDRRAANPDGPS